MNEKTSKNDDRIQAPFIGVEDIEDEFFEENQPLEPPPETFNVRSWFLIFTPEELPIIALILAIIISSGLTLEEKAVVGAFFTVLADNTFLIAAQETLIKSAINEQKALDDYNKALIDKEKERLNKRKEAREKKKEEEEKQKLLDDIKDMKEQIKKLESIINNQIRL